MARFIRNTVILAGLEGTYGTDASPVGATDAMLVSNCTIRPLVANNVPRDLIRGYFGGSEQLVGTNYVEVSFTVEIAGRGASPVTAPTWGRLLRACAFDSTTQAASVDYLPISTFGSSTSNTIYYQLDGLQHKLLGARGTFSIEMGVGERPEFRFRFVGLNGGISATSNATPTLTTFATPKIPTDTNTADITIGAVTYTAASGTVSGGTAYTSRGIRFDLGNSVNFQPLIGGESVEITGREVTGRISLDLTASQAVTFMSTVTGNTTTAIGVTHGTASGNTIVLHLPAVQFLEPEIEDLDGRILHAYTLRAVPSSGNDEIRIVVR